MIMAKKSSRRVHLGDPEHIISPEQARKMLSNQLKYRPEDTTAPHIDHGTIPVIGDTNVLDTEKFKSTYNLDAKNFGHATELLADEVISRLEGNTRRFNRFTVESIAVMTEPMLEILAKSGTDSRLADDIDTAINMLPASNARIFTSVQMLRTEEYMLEPVAYHEASDYAVNNARYSRALLDDKLKMTSPRGKDTLDAVVKESKTPFEDLSAVQQDAIIAIYDGNEDVLDTVIDRSHDSGYTAAVAAADELFNNDKDSVTDINLEMGDLADGQVEL